MSSDDDDGAQCPTDVLTDARRAMGGTHAQHTLPPPRRQQRAGPER